MSNLINHAQRELETAGMLGARGDKFDEYNNMCGEAVMELIRVFAGQNHSGMSASITLGMFKEVADFKALSPLTDNPKEWIAVEAGPVSDEITLWQNNRRSDAFSEDCGKTYYLLDECRRGWRRKLFGMAPVHTSEKVT